MPDPVSQSELLPSPSRALSGKDEVAPAEVDVAEFRNAPKPGIRRRDTQWEPMTDPDTGRRQPRDPAGAELLVELMQHSSLGDEAAFAALYDATSPKVYGLALRVTRSPEMAAEVTQEVYFMAWQQSGSFVPERGTVLGWLCTLAHRRAVDRIRQVVKERDREEVYERRQNITSPDQTWQEVEEAMDVTEVRAGLTALTPLQREALGLAYYQGCTYQEVARQLDIPLGTAKARIRDGLRNLRSALGGQP